METYAQTAARVGREAQAMDFGTPFRVYPLGTVSPVSVSAPECIYHDDDDDVTGVPDSWEPLTGMSGQYSYSGAVMHPSEYIGEGIGARLWDEAHDSGEPQTYVIVTVEVYPTDDDPEPEPAGWAILRKR